MSALSVAQMTKRSLDKCRTTVLDPVLGRTIETLKRKPVLIEYTVGSGKYTKTLMTPTDLEFSTASSDCRCLQDMPRMRCPSRRCTTAPVWRPRV